MSRAHSVVANLLYPSVCLLCHGSLPAPAIGRQAGLLADRTTICEVCEHAMPRNHPPVCVQCGLGLPGAFDAMMQCQVCRSRPRAFEIARAPWEYLGPVQQAVQQFKYHRRWRIGRWLAQGMVTTAQRALSLDEVDLVLPVPLHWLKRRLKGWNPAEELARAVSEAIDKPCAPSALRRRRWTTTQTRLHESQRARNVHRAFRARPRLIHDRTILLIDDVLTSGATANACALALKEAGACKVFVLTAARTPRV